MNLRLDRDDKSATRTIGNLYVAKWLAYTLEDPVHTGPKVAGETAIPAGRYQVVITESERFGRPLPLLLGVAGFEGIRIHPGNTTADTRGCILPGLTRTVDKVLYSRPAADKIQTLIQAALDRGEQVWIDIN